MYQRSKNPDAWLRAGARRNTLTLSAESRNGNHRLALGQRDALAAIERARVALPELCRFGILPQPCDAEFSVEGVVTALSYLRQYRKRAGTPRLSSYWLKHRAERWGCRRALACYVTTGEMVVAAHYLGFPLKRYGNSPNLAVGVSLPRSYVRRAAWGEVD